MVRHIILKSDRSNFKLKCETLVISLSSWNPILQEQNSIPCPKARSWFLQFTGFYRLLLKDEGKLHCGKNTGLCQLF